MRLGIDLGIEPIMMSISLLEKFTTSRSNHFALMVKEQAQINRISLGCLTKFPCITL